MTLTTYKLVCDYDGTVDWSGAYREVEPFMKDFEMGDYTLDGTIYKRVRMPWDTSKVVGSREYRRRNLRLFLHLKMADEDAVRLLEAWTMKFPELWEPNRGFDSIIHWDKATYESLNGLIERPQATNTTLFDTVEDGFELYFGSYTGKFTEIDAYLETVEVGGSYQWEYSSGDDVWDNLTVSNGDWSSSAVMSWTAPGDWVAVTDPNIANDTPMFMVRCTCSSKPTTAPVAYFLKRHRPISLYLMESTDAGVTWEFWNREYISDAYYPNGWVIESCHRMLLTGKPNEYEVRLNLMEANY